MLHIVTLRIYIHADTVSFFCYTFRCVYIRTYTLSVLFSTQAVRWLRLDSFYPVITFLKIYANILIKREIKYEIYYIYYYKIIFKIDHICMYIL